MANNREDKKHFSRLRMLPCLKCGRSDTVVAHIRKFTDGATALKPSPWFTVPLCNVCHSEQHQRGEVTFWGGIEGVYKAIDWARKLYDANDIFEAQRIILQARKDLF